MAREDRYRRALERLRDLGHMLTLGMVEQIVAQALAEDAVKIAP
jgi:hypothetical protein